jgi:hypothetical protein
LSPAFRPDGISTICRRGNLNSGFSEIFRQQPKACCRSPRIGPDGFKVSNPPPDWAQGRRLGAAGQLIFPRPVETPSQGDALAAKGLDFASFQTRRS